MAERAKKRPGPGRPKDEGLPARRRAEIITHAIAEFARSGYDGADLDAIAKNAGVSKGTLYNYFESKGALFNAAVDHVMFAMKANAGTCEDDDPLVQLEKLVLSFLKHFAENPQHVELLVHERSGLRDRPEPAYVKYRSESRKAWTGRFEKLMAQGRMRKMSSDQALNIMGDLLYGTIFMNHFRGRKIRPESQAAELLDVLLGGLLAPPELKAWQKRD